MLCVTGAYAPELSSGGLQTQAMLGLLRGRVEAAVLTTSTNPSLPARDTIDGVPVSRVGIDVTSRRSSLLAMVRMAAAVARLLPRADLVHVQGVSTKNILISAMARLWRRPVIVHLQTARHDEPPAVKAQGRLAWWAFRSASLYLSVSPALAAASRAAGVPAEKIREVPNGVDASRFGPARPDDRLALRRQLGLPLERPVVLYVGIFSRDKQPQVLLKAWLTLQADPACASTLVCVGATSPRQFEADAELAAGIRRDADRSGFGDRLVLADPTARIQDYFRAADVFVLPSAREGLPIVLLEAMACGLPCIASRLPGSTDVMIEDGVNGRLVPSGDADGLGRALRAVLTNPADAARLGAAARTTIEARFTMAHVAEEWLATYKEVIGRRP